MQMKMKTQPRTISRISHHVSVQPLVFVTAGESMPEMEGSGIGTDVPDTCGTEMRSEKHTPSPVQVRQTLHWRCSSLAYRNPCRGLRSNLSMQDSCWGLRPSNLNSCCRRPGSFHWSRRRTGSWNRLGDNGHSKVQVGSMGKCYTG